MAKGLEDCPEGGERCFLCYELRLREAAELAKKMQMDYFTTTLSISPLKNAEKLNEIGDALAEEYSIAYLNSDFKKKNGYKRSVELLRMCFFKKSERQGNCPEESIRGLYKGGKHHGTVMGRTFYEGDRSACL